MVARNTTIRDKHRAIIKRRREPCALCGEPIDYSLPYLHPREFVVDHVVSLARGGADTIDNKQPAHRNCNRTKGKGDPLVAVVLSTRKW